MEEILPSSVADADALAPEEVYAKKRGRNAEFLEGEDAFEPRSVRDRTCPVGHRCCSTDAPSPLLFSCMLIDSCILHFAGGMLLLSCILASWCLTSGIVRAWVRRLDAVLMFDRGR